MQVTTSRIDEIAGDDKELKKLLLQLFSATFDKCLGKFETAIKVKDEKKSKEDWHDAAHELKGSAYNLGFNELGDRCTKAENCTEIPEKEKFIKILKLISLEVTKMVEKFG